MDLSVILKNQKLNIRTTAIIIHENKLLVHKKLNEDYCALIGGRIKIGESSAHAIKREVFEEMGKKIEIMGYVTTIENFFEGEIPYHEIMFVYRAEFADEEDKKLLNTIKNIEGEDDLEYQWIDLDKLEEARLNPACLRDMIKNNDFKPHVIHDERMKKFYENTEDKEPYKNVKEFLDKKRTPGKAFDIGCGAGRDTIALIKQGWNVTSIDGRNTKDYIVKKLSKEELERFEFQRQEFENIRLEENNLVVANYSLSFCDKDCFMEMWSKIENSILPYGYFIGNFFGLNDEWKDLPKYKNKTFLTKKEVMNLFKNFEIISFEEVEKDGWTDMGESKHWHYFDVVARKK